MPPETATPAKPSAVPPKAPAVSQQADPANPPPAEPTFTKADMELYATNRVKQATAPMEEQIKKLSPYAKAAEVPEDIRNTATEVRAANRHARALGRDYKLPASAINALTSILDPDLQEQMAKDLAPQINDEALAAVEAKLKGKASEEKIENLGGGGSGTGLAPAATADNIDALWFAAEQRDPASNPYTTQYRKFIQTGSLS